MNILYIRCTCRTRDRQLMQEYQSKGYDIRRTKGSKVIAAEAESYHLLLPFVVENGKARQL